MGTQVSMNEEVPDILLPEREVDSVISSVKTEVSRYELSTNLAIWDSDSDLDMDEIICDVGNDHNYLTENYVMLKFLKQPKTRGITLCLSLKGMSCLLVIFVLTWLKQALTWFSLGVELEIDCLTSRILLQKVYSYKYQFCTKVCAS